jgi:glutaredoxin
MNLTLYSTGCPKCKVLKAKLDQKDLTYDIETDIEKMKELNILSVPVLKVDDKFLQFKDAIDWVNSLTVEVTD